MANPTNSSPYTDDEKLKLGLKTTQLSESLYDIDEEGTVGEEVSRIGPIPRNGSDGDLIPMCRVDDC